MERRSLRTLLFSSLYPSSVRPAHGIFVETRLRKLLETGEVETRVVAPVPWFPLTHSCFGDYAKFAATPEYENWHGQDVYHPRYLLLPKIGMNLAPQAMARAALPVVRKLIDQGFDFDLIDAHYYYPDGVAAGIIAEKLGKSFVVTARGTDLNLIPEFEQPRQRILETAHKASASIGVCKALMDRLAELGADTTKLHVLRNGVDLERFIPMDRAESRAMLGLPPAKTILLSVGLLVERKGHHLAIGALPKLPDVSLVIVGEGIERQSLENQARALGVADRVVFAGRVDNEKLKWWYSAADALVLCSSREGWANVLLEAMACGTPVIATNIWGTPEVVASKEAGVLMSERTSDALRLAFEDLFYQYPVIEATRCYAERYSWGETTEGQLRIFNKVIGNQQ